MENDMNAYETLRQELAASPRSWLITGVSACYQHVQETVNVGAIGSNGVFK